jgi:alpha-glucosidase (family GH31 glycosyl hydrolase)
MIGESVLAAPLLRNYKDGKKDIYLPGGTWFDWETGRKFLGPVTLEAYDIPLQKTPCFVGGKGVVLLRKGNSEDVVARVYEVGKNAVSDFYTLKEGKKYTIETQTTELAKATVLNLSTGEKVAFSKGTGFIEFPVTEGCDYLVGQSR